jgi:phosphoglycerate-specific signal transduction histidine kinase
MPSQQAGPTGQAALAALAHDLRSALAASTAYLDLAKERLEQGEPLAADDLAKVERGLGRVADVVARLDALAKGAKA